MPRLVAGDIECVRHDLIPCDCEYCRCRHVACPKYGDWVVYTKDGRIRYCNDHLPGVVRALYALRGDDLE